MTESFRWNTLIEQSDWVMLVTALSPLDAVRRRREPSNSSLPQFSAFPLRAKEEGWRGWERGHSSWAEGRFPNLPPWHSSGLKEAQGQKWAKTGTDRLGVAKGSHFAETLLGPSAVLSSLLTSLPGLEVVWSIRGSTYYTVCPHVTRPAQFHSVSYLCLHWQKTSVFIYSLLGEKHQKWICSSVNFSLQWKHLQPQI